ncbi:MAG TPA: class I SAM-dependent methyltransferase [Streptosporangiaceae bacterium]|jgi:ubiquinone/menaquinone biosynthesis C-methylase UbiE|nr:class I SAM-dependent methyltransferase [Streptosporangiaceae bacterium]
MGLLDWDHNAYYHRLLMRQLPSPCPRALDVGCGAGAFAAELATRALHVDALDRSPEMIEAARQITPANVTCILGDVMRAPLPAEHYDAIVSVTALHHMPLDDALRVLDPPLTTREVRQHATRTLPGAQVRRLIFWRYLLLWKRPVETHANESYRLT